MSNGPGSFIRSSNLTLPPTEAILIDVSAEDADFSASPLRGISIGTAGDLKVDTINATGVVIPGNCFAVGIQHVLLITKIYNTGTAASEIIGWR